MNTVKSFTNYYAGKFWRESQKKPTDYIIVPDQRGGAYVAIKVGSSNEAK